ncbi:MAG: TRAP transporter small permease [Clostridiales Family XIII bacterium]|jgi:C4-dicarboxylate transporter DctQ subunit|nr:TRAP transporter small permease [Clostridiales Family XIII bacterium]
MPSALVKLDKILEAIEKNIVGYATIIMVIILFINVVLRNFFHSGLVWGNELSSYLNILAVYFAVSAGFKYGSHVGVSAFVDYVIPKALRKGTAVLTNLITLLFCAVVLWLAYRMSLAQFANGQVSPVMSFPLGAIYTILLLGMIFSCLRLVIEIVKLRKGDGTRGGEASC